jgi:hypothetical protein
LGDLALDLGNELAEGLGDRGAEPPPDSVRVFDLDGEDLDLFGEV